MLMIIKFPMKLKPYLMFLAGWFVPGLGHLLMKKYKRAVIFFVSILAMFVVGILIHGRFFEDTSGNPLAMLAYFGDLGNGILFFIAKKFSLLNIDFSASTFEYGTAYLATSGFLNFMVAINAYDIAKGKRK